MDTAIGHYETTYIILPDGRKEREKKRSWGSNRGKSVLGAL